jgi:hypothetical protein
MTNEQVKNLAKLGSGLGPTVMVGDNNKTKLGNGSPSSQFDLV